MGLSKKYRVSLLSSKCRTENSLLQGTVHWASCPERDASGIREKSNHFPKMMLLNHVT